MSSKELRQEICHHSMLIGETSGDIRMNNLVDERISNIVALKAVRDNEATIEREAKAKADREIEERKAAARFWWEDAGEKMWLDALNEVNEPLTAAGIQVELKDMAGNIPLGAALYRHYVHVLLDGVAQKGSANISVNAFGNILFSYLKGHEDIGFKYSDATREKFAEAITAIVEGSLKKSKG